MGELAVTYTLVGEVLAEPVLCYSDMKLTLAMMQMTAWKSTLEKVFKTVSGEGTKGEEYPDTCYQAEKVYVCKNKIARPRVFIPVFPGTNCEYDSTKAFERAGADVDVKVFKNLTAEDIRDSVNIFEKSIRSGSDHHVPGWILRR